MQISKRNIDTMNEEHISSEEAMKRLTYFGFQKYGHWESVDPIIKRNGILFVPEPEKEIPDVRGIYAFVAFIDEKPVESRPVKYVGINDNTNGTLQKRMERYSIKPKNQKNANKILECLEMGCSVDIFAYIPNYKTTGTEHYKDVEIDYVKGLENGLIRYLDAEWNKKR